MEIQRRGKDTSGKLKMLNNKGLTRMMFTEIIAYLPKIHHTREKLIPTFLDGVPKECRHGINIWPAQEKKQKNPLRNVTRATNPVRTCP